MNDRLKDAAKSQGDLAGVFRSANGARPLALVTGASRGIGAAVAWRLLEWGADVIVAARGLAGCEALVARWDGHVQAGGRSHQGITGAGDLDQAGAAARAFALALDVTDTVAIKGLPDAVIKLAGRPVTWLVNNAGHAATAPLLRTDDAAFQAALALNFDGPRRVTSALLPAMLEALASAKVAAHQAGYAAPKSTEQHMAPSSPTKTQFGAVESPTSRPAIVHVASSAGLQGYAYCAAYCASKHALVGYTRAAAIELAQKQLAMFAVAPHFVETPMLRDSIQHLVDKTGQTADQARAFFAAQNPGKRLIRPAEVAEQVLACLLSAPHPDQPILELDGRTDAV